MSALEISLGIISIVLFFVILYFVVKAAVRNGILEAQDFGKPYAEKPATPGTSISQVICPGCGNAHDMDYPKCPYCGHV